MVAETVDVQFTKALHASGTQLLRNAAEEKHLASDTLELVWGGNFKP